MLCIDMKELSGINAGITERQWVITCLISPTYNKYGTCIILNFAD